MPLINEHELHRVGDLIISKSYNFSKSADQILIEASMAFKSVDGYDIFLSHSYRDAKEILGLKALLTDFGYTVYVDWIDDRQMDRTKVSTATAERLRTRIGKCRCLMFVTSANSPASVWMPWELGYADAKHGRVAVMPIASGFAAVNDYHGQEYLALYPFVTKDHAKRTGVETLFVNVTLTNYVGLSDWLKGQPPFQH